MRYDAMSPLLGDPPTRYALVPSSWRAHALAVCRVDIARTIVPAYFAVCAPV